MIVLASIDTKINHQLDGIKLYAKCSKQHEDAQHHTFHVIFKYVSSSFGLGPLPTRRKQPIDLFLQGLRVELIRPGWSSDTDPVMAAPHS
jgi:hypothetical protein